jgi:hypothetical protein
MGMVDLDDLSVEVRSCEEDAAFEVEVSPRFASPATTAAREDDESLRDHHLVQLDPLEWVDGGWESLAAGISTDPLQCPNAEKSGEESLFDTYLRL